MIAWRSARFLLATIPVMALLGSCGGGSGSAGTFGGTAGSGGSALGGAGPPPPAPAATWVKGQFAAESKFAAMCVTPRTGTDPATSKPYPDRQGTLLDELNWLRSWNNDLYLWYSEVTDQNPANFSSDASYFAVLKTTATTPSGNPKDKFHFTYLTSTWESLSQSGVQAGYGVDFVLLSATPPRNVLVGYTEPAIPAGNAAANLIRGVKIVTVDGVDLVNASDQASVDALNAGMFPATAGESHTFGVLDPGATTPRTVTLVSANVTETPVQNVHTIPAGGGTMGYILFNDHIATAEDELVSAFTQLQTAAVTDLVLDIRYNGGGYLAIASEVAYMIAGAGPTTNQTFELQQFNGKYPTNNPIDGSAITPVPFLTSTQGLAGTPKQTLPTLNLARVFLLTGPNTCSASESIINSLQGVGIQVIQIGSTTCGKPYGFYPQDNCGVTYFSIEFKDVNAKNFGDYTDGFTPANATSATGATAATVPGCSVADDFAHALGDPAEARLAAALGYSTGGAASCPAASGVAPPTPLVGAAYVPPRADGLMVKSLWRQNRILSRPRTP
jgi:carboxyl-terminal processing protease